MRWCVWCAPVKGKRQSLIPAAAAADAGTAVAADRIGCRESRAHRLDSRLKSCRGFGSASASASNGKRAASIRLQLHSFAQSLAHTHTHTACSSVGSAFLAACLPLSLCRCCCCAPRAHPSLSCCLVAATAAPSSLQLQCRADGSPHPCLPACLSRRPERLPSVVVHRHGSTRSVL